MFSLQNRVAVVTGAGRGIGRAIAVALAKAGAKVAITARTAAELDEVVRAVQQDGGQALAVAADLTQKEAIAKIIDETSAKLGLIDILVNNAGIGSSSDPRPVAEFSDDFWDLS